MNECTKEYMNDCMNEGNDEWIYEMNKWMNGWNRWIIERNKWNEMEWH